MLIATCYDLIIMFVHFRYWLAHGAEPKKSVAVLLGLVRNTSRLYAKLVEILGQLIEFKLNEGLLLC